MRFALLLAVACAVLAVSNPVPAQVTIVGLLPPGMDHSEAIAINDDGLVLVRASVAGQRIISWLHAPDGTWINPGVPAGFDYGSVNGINDDGYAVATVVSGTFATAAVRSPDGTWSLPMPGQGTVATAINSGGSIVGYELVGSAARMFLYEPGIGVTPIPNGEVPANIAIAIDSTGPGLNNHGIVYGAAFVDNGVRAFRYSRDDGFLLLPTETGQESEAGGANDAGELVGWSGLPSGSVAPVKWLKDGTFKPLPAASGFLWANGLNNVGEVVGSGFLAGPRAVLWSDHLGMVDLNEMISPDDQLHWELRIAYRTNDQRQIVGMGLYDPDGPAGSTLPTPRGFLLQIPEPAPGVLGLTALLLVILGRNKGVCGS